MDGNLELRDEDSLDTLQEITLQTIVLHFEEIFLEKLNHDEIQGRVKSGLVLPNGFFERILEKSRKMKWMIMPHYLKTCLPAANELNWHNIRFPCAYRPDSCLSRRDFEMILEMEVVPKRLSFSATRLNAEDFAILSKLGSTLECLEINSVEEFSWQKRGKVKFEKASYSNLSELSLNCAALLRRNPDYVNLESCCSALQVLKLEYARIKKPYLNQMKSLTKLKTLSLHGSKLLGFMLDELTGVIETMEDLEKLDLAEIKHKISLSCDQEAMGKMMTKLQKLESLEIGDNELARYIHWLPKRRYKYLGLYHCYEYTTLQSLDVERISSSFELETVLTAAEEYMDRKVLFARVLRSFHYEHINSFLTTENLKRLENILLDGIERYVMFGNIKKGCGIHMIDRLILPLVKILTSKRETKEFMRKLANLLVSSCNLANLSAEWSILSCLKGNIEEEFYLEVVSKFFERCVEVCKYTGDRSMEVEVVKFLCEIMKPDLHSLEHHLVNQVVMCLRELLKNSKCLEVFAKQTGCNALDDLEKKYFDKEKEVTGCLKRIH